MLRATYGRLLAQPHAPSLLAWPVLARMPLGMTAFGLVLLIRAEGGGYGAAGGVAAAFGVAISIGSPISSRMVDRRGAHGVLVARSIVFPGLLGVIVALSLVDAPIVAIGAAATLVGVAIPPIAPTVRSVWPRIVADDLRGVAYAVEATVQELVWVVGPLLAAALCAAHPAAGVAGAALAGGLGTAMFARLAPVRALQGSSHEQHPLGPLVVPAIRAIMAFAVAIGLGFGIVEVTMPAFAEIHATRELGGLALACFALGSLLGGVVAGMRPPRDPVQRFLRTGPLIAAGMLCFPLAWSMPSLLVLAVIAGLPVAPVVASVYGVLDRIAPPGATAEAFAWFGTAIGLGIAAGFAVGGAVAEEVSVRLAFALAPALAALGTVVLFAWRSRFAVAPLPAAPAAI